MVRDSGLLFWATL